MLHYFRKTSNLKKNNTSYNKQVYENTVVVEYTSFSVFIPLKLVYTSSAELKFNLYAPSFVEKDALNNSSKECSSQYLPYDRSKLAEPLFGIYSKRFTT